MGSLQEELRPPHPRARRCSRDAGFGFSLVELLVVLAIVGVLTAILVPWLAGVRRAGAEARSLSNLRTHAQAMSAYAGDYASVLPYITRLGFEVNRLEGGGVVIESCSYFDAHRVWHVVLAEPYYNAPATSTVFFPPRYQQYGDAWPYLTPYFYPCVYIARPEFWTPETRMGGSQFAPTRLDEVQHPDAKSLIVESWPYLDRVLNDPERHRLVPLPVAFGDGSARSVPWDQRVGGYERGEGNQFAADGAVHYSDSPPLLHTLRGVRGRDVR
ncbi:MAG: prepilin-type N-terminal cleavage/methylation domain-containing protein [Phycisphaeraceae bacterium]|nr:MAG: prepilin-type N-terminal cleavage/methylation domain-containing protein [Phycisphaeraceae bacterium]